MIEDFADKRTLDHFEGRKPHKELPPSLHRRATLLLDSMDAAETLKSFESKVPPPSLRIHKLKGNKKGRIAIDIDKVSGWRITFIWKDNLFHDVLIENYH